MIATLNFDRVLVIAPHPDDESIGTGALIQRVLAAGGRLQVIFVTDGDNNAFPQRLAGKKWRITADDRAKWGTMRRQESRAALSQLGAPVGTAIFLGYADRSLARMAERGDRRVAEGLRAIIAAFDPLLVVSPSGLDLHADHRAVALFAHDAADDRPIITYLVHGDVPAERIAARLELTTEEVTRKRAAIERHESQLRFSRERFLSYATPEEVFLNDEHDIVQPDSLWWKWRCKTLHGWRVVKGMV